MITNGKRIRASETAEKSESARSGGKRLAKKQGITSRFTEKKPGPSLKERLSLGRKRFWRKLTRKELLILLIPAIAAVVAVVAIFVASRDTLRYTLEGEPCQYYAGNVYPMTEGTVMRRTSKDLTIIDGVGGSRELTSLPIYYTDRQSVTLPQDMVFYAPRSGVYGRLPYFTELTLRSNGSTAARHPDGEPQGLELGFVYDGKDFYFFLEPMILSFNGYRMELPAFSYVEACYTGDIMVFNYGSKEFFIEAPMGSVIAETVTGDYSIALLGDTLTTYNGERKLLFTRPELLNPVVD